MEVSLAALSNAFDQQKLDSARRVTEVDDRFEAMEASLATLSENQDADWLESVFARFQSVEASIAALAHSVHIQKAENLVERVRAVEEVATPRGSAKKAARGSEISKKLLTGFHFS